MASVLINSKIFGLWNQRSSKGEVKAGVLPRQEKILSSRILREVGFRVRARILVWQRCCECIRTHQWSIRQSLPTCQASAPTPIDRNSANQLRRDHCSRMWQKTGPGSNIHYWPPIILLVAADRHNNTESDGTAGNGGGNTTPRVTIEIRSTQGHKDCQFIHRRVGQQNSAYSGVRLLSRWHHCIGSTHSRVESQLDQHRAVCDKGIAVYSWSKSNIQAYY